MHATKTCRKCETTYPATDEFFPVIRGKLSSPCRECVRKKGRKHYQDNKEVYLQRKHDYYYSNIPLIRQQSRSYYVKNSNVILKKAKNYYHNNRPQILAQHHNYYMGHRTDWLNNQRRWRAANPEAYRVQGHKRRGWKAGGKVTGDDIKRQFKSQRYRCWWCQQKLRGKPYHIDHRIPLVKGGTHTPDNIVIACPTCNLRKGGKTPQEFAGRLF